MKDGESQLKSIESKLSDGSKHIEIQNSKGDVQKTIKFHRMA